MQGKRCLVPVFVLLFLIGVPGSVYSGGISGNQLVENMREYENFDMDSFDPGQVLKAAHYMGYVGGVADILQNFGLIRAEKATHGQYFAVVAKFLKANPEKWHQSAMILVVDALLEAFPLE